MCGKQEEKSFCVYVFSAEGWGSSLKHKTQAPSVRIVCFRYKSMRESGDMACRYVNDFQSRNGSSLSGAGKKRAHKWRHPPRHGGGSCADFVRELERHNILSENENREIKPAKTHQKVVMLVS